MAQPGPSPPTDGKRGGTRPRCAAPGRAAAACPAPGSPAELCRPGWRLRGAPQPGGGEAAGGGPAGTEGPGWGLGGRGGVGAAPPAWWGRGRPGGGRLVGPGGAAGQGWRGAVAAAGARGLAWRRACSHQEPQKAEVGIPAGRVGSCAGGDKGNDSSPLGRSPGYLCRSTISCPGGFCQQEVICFGRDYRQGNMIFFFFPWIRLQSCVWIRRAVISAWFGDGIEGTSPSGHPRACGCVGKG